MNRKLSAASTRRPASRRVPPRVKRRFVQTTEDQNVSDALLAHWTAMHDAMVATGALRR
ncbi:MAG: hypothetical protein AAGC86_04360 [Pseudomonadota bacterium]